MPSQNPPLYPKRIMYLTYWTPVKGQSKLDSTVLVIQVNCLWPQLVLMHKNDKRHIIYLYVTHRVFTFWIYTDILVESSVFYGTIPLENSSADFGEQVVSHSANDPVEATILGLYLITFQVWHMVEYLPLYLNMFESKHEYNNKLSLTISISLWQLIKFAWL
jgi:hypothetical protein